MEYLAKAEKNMWPVDLLENIKLTALTDRWTKFYPGTDNLSCSYWYRWREHNNEPLQNRDQHLPLGINNTPPPAKNSLTQTHFFQSKRNVKSSPRTRLFEGNIAAKYSLLASTPPDIHQALRVLLTVVNFGRLPCSHLLLNIITILRKL